MIEAKAWDAGARILTRLSTSTVVWLWIFNGLRLAMGLLVLPLLLHYLSTEELGMFYVFLSLSAVVPLIDFGFSGTIERFVSFAIGGASDIQAQGVVPCEKPAGPNYKLVWQLLFNTRRLYRYLSLGAFVLLGIAGTYAVELRIHELASPAQARLAWAVTLVAAAFDIYSNWWAVFLRGMNQVLLSARVLVLAYCIRLILAVSLLYAGNGLLSLPIATLLSSLLLRFLARRFCLQLLPETPKSVASRDGQSLMRKLWPNSWRLGLQICSGYLTNYANTLICLDVLGLAANAKYGLSLQIIMILQGMAAVWTLAKWPLINQYRARQDFAGIRRVFWPRVWLQSLTFLLMAGFAIAVAPGLLKWISSDKSMLPTFWLVLLGVNAFLEMQFNMWGTLISTENRLPYLWPALATNVLAFCLSLTLIHQTRLGLGGLVLGPLCAGLLFNYWYWPLASARNLKTTLFHYLFTPPSQEQPALTPLAR